MQFSQKMMSSVGMFFVGLLFSVSSQAAQLGSQEEMLSQLSSVLNETNVAERYYPVLLAHAGTEKNPQQIVDMFADGTEKFLATFPAAESKMVRVQIVPYEIPFIRALLRNNPAEAEEAVAIFLKSNRPQRVQQ